MISYVPSQKSKVFVSFFSVNTGHLEAFHSALLKYTPKHQCFGLLGMKVRTHLAIREHNENVGRKQARTAKGIYESTIPS